MKLSEAIRTFAGNGGVETKKETVNVKVGNHSDTNGRGEGKGLHIITTTGAKYSHDLFLVKRDGQVCLCKSPLTCRYGKFYSTEGIIISDTEGVDLSDLPELVNHF